MISTQGPQLRILASARDAGAGGHIGAIALELRARGHEVILLADGPAFDLCREHLLYPRPSREFFAAELPETSIDARTLHHVGNVVHAAGPDVILLGQSHRSEFSVDDWLLAAADGIPTVAMQDFWGEVKFVNSRTADLFLVLDDAAALCTRTKCEATTMVVGSPKHSWYETLDGFGLRQRSRRALALGMSDYVVGYFGQALHHLAAYGAVVRDVGRAVAGTAARLPYRPHPREDESSIARTMELLVSGGAEPILQRDSTLEASITLVDVVVSCFSTCGYDALHLNRSQGGLDHVVVYADYYAEIRRDWALHAGLATLPPVSAGLALRAGSAEHLKNLVVELRTSERRRARKEIIEATLPECRNAPMIAADAIEAFGASRRAAQLSLIR